MIHLMQSQLDATIELLQCTIARFDDESWQAGFADLHYPWKVAWHTIECLEGYFSLGVESRAGGHFGRPCPQMPVPSISEMQTYLDAIKAIIEQRARIDDQRDPSEIYHPGDHSGHNVLERYVYAIRHTMHHHGALAALAVKAGIRDIMWK